jgi:hypothetical protein
MDTPQEIFRTRDIVTFEEGPGNPKGQWAVAWLEMVNGELHYGLNRYPANGDGDRFWPVSEQYIMTKVGEAPV